MREKLTEALYYLASDLQTMQSKLHIMDDVMRLFQNEEMDRPEAMTVYSGMYWSIAGDIRGIIKDVEDLRNTVGGKN